MLGPGLVVVLSTRLHRQMHQENVRFIFDVRVFVLQKPPSSSKSLSSQNMSFMVFVFGKSIIGFGHAYFALRVGLWHLSHSQGILFICLIFGVFFKSKKKVSQIFIINKQDLKCYFVCMVVDILVDIKRTERIY